MKKGILTRALTLLMCLALLLSVPVGALADTQTNTGDVTTPDIGTEITPDEGDDEFEDEENDLYAKATDVSSAKELSSALEMGAEAIRITADFSLDRTFFVTSSTVIFTDEAHTLTRDKDFGGDIFVVGEYEDGSACEDSVSLQMGHHESLESDLLVIDGNKENMDADVVGTVFFIRKNTTLNLYTNLTVKNCKKVGNERTLNEVYGLSYADRVGGPVAIVSSGVMNIYGGNYSNNETNYEGEEADLVSDRGGAFYLFGKANIYGGTFKGNKAFRAGAFYVYRTLNIYGGTINNNYAANRGGAIYMAASTLAYLYVKGENDESDEGVVFSGNHAVGYGGALFAQGVLVELDDATFDSNTSAYNGGAVYASMGNDSETEHTFTSANSTFKNNTADYNGGAVYLTSTSAYFENATFEGNTAKATANSSGSRYGGGAVYGTDSYIEMNGALFKENKSEYRGAGIILYAASKVVLNNITTQGNTSANAGGFIYTSASEIHIYNSAIRANTSGNHGGAISLMSESTLHAYLTTFEGNAATGHGGAIYAYAGAVESLLHSCVFVDNTATSNGGAIYASNKSIVTAYNTSSKGNSANSGGFLYETTTGTTVTLNGFTTSGNSATDSGPIIYGNSTGAVLNINKTTYIDIDLTGSADSTYWAGAIANKLKVVEITDEVPGFINYGDTEETPPEAIVNPNVTNIVELQAAFNAKIPVITIISDFYLDRTLYVTKSVTLYTSGNRTLTRRQDFGGDIFVIGEDPDGEEILTPVEMNVKMIDDTSTLTIDGNKDNMKVDVVGTVFFNCNKSTLNLYDGLTVKNCHKVGNERTADYSLSYTDRIGGPVAIHASGEMNIYGGVYTNNSVNDEEVTGNLISTQGGAFYSYATFNVYGGVFSNNFASRGGVFYNYRKMNIHKATINNNSATYGGGVIYLPASTVCYLNIGTPTNIVESKVVMKNNTSAGFAGTIYVQGAKTQIENTEFVNNTSGNHGGALYITGSIGEDGKAKYIVKNSTFKENISDFNGGAVYLTSTGADFENVDFIGNHSKATENASGNRYGGGAIYSTGSISKYEGVRFTDNSSDYLGGGVYLNSSSEGTFFNVTASGNSASSGGFLYNKATATIYDSKINNNIASSNGGGVNTTSPGTTNIYNTSFVGNEAYTGGALYFYTSEVQSTVHSCVIENNIAENFGGGMYASNKSLVDVINTKAIGNSAYRGGFLYETTTGTTVTLNGITVSGNTASDAGPIIYGNSNGAILNLNKSNWVDKDVDGALNDAYWKTAIINKLKVVEITDGYTDYDEYGEENYDNLKGFVSVSSASELEKALEREDKIIRITSDITVDRTFYVTNKTTIFSTSPYRLKRHPEFAGDMFVVGEYKNGRSVLLDHGDTTLTLGNPESKTENLLVLDGNRNNMQVDVVGSLIFVCHSADVVIYNNTTLTNAKKIGNERTFKEGYYFKYPEVCGGAGILQESGKIVINGGNFNNLCAEDETGTLLFTGGGIFTQSDITINGGNFEFCKGYRGGAMYLYRMAHITAGNFRNNYSSTYGGAIYIASTELAHLYLGDTTGETKLSFEGNMAYKYGGAVYSGSKPSIIIYGDTEFVNNTSEKSYGGAISTAGLILANNTTFKGNFAYTGGGAVRISYGNDTVSHRLSSFTNCVFEGNISNRGGAASIYSSGMSMKTGAHATFTDCQFTNNEARDRVNTNSVTSSYGGAIYTSYKSNITATNTTFTGNTAGREAGAVYMAYESVLNATDCSFTENAVTSETLGYGGAISLHSSFLNVDNVTFKENYSYSRGGAIYVSYNSAIKTDSVAKLTNSTFENNHCDVSGGAIFCVDRKRTDDEGNSLEPDTNYNLIVKDSTVKGNTSGQKGGAVSMQTYPRAYFNNVDFIDNKITEEGSGHNGGAIYAASRAFFNINKATFENNISGSYAGAIGMYSNSSSIINQVTATGNYAPVYGGFMHLDTAYTKIYNSEISENSANSRGGAISLVDSSTCDVTGSTFKNNTAVNDGGAFYIYPGAVKSTFHTCTFEGNTAGAYGGAIMLSNKSLLDLFNITAKNNSADKGGFMYETVLGSVVTVNGLTLSGNTATTSGPIIHGNTLNAKLFYNKANWVDEDVEGELDETYFASAFAHLLTVAQISDEIPSCDTYENDYKEQEIAQTTPAHKEISVENIFKLAQKSSDVTINGTYGALKKLDNSSNFMSENTTVFEDINGKDVTVDTFVYRKDDPSGNGNVGEGLLIYQAMLYKKVHPEEDVSISISSFRFSVPAAICINRNSRYFGYMRNLYGMDYDQYGFVRISYLLKCAASMGINVTVIGQLEGYPSSSTDPKLYEYFTQSLNAPCDSEYVENGVVGDYMNFQYCYWTSYGDKAATDMMHTKMCAVSHYLDMDGNEHENAVWSSSSNLDGVNSDATNGNDKMQTATIVSDHAEIYRIAKNYLDLVASTSGEQEDVYYFRDIAIKRATEQIALINEGREAEIPKDEQIVYLGSENDNVFEFYFTPLGGGMYDWDENTNAYAKYLRALNKSDDYIWVAWNNVKFGRNQFTNQMEQMVIDAFHKNKNPNNKIYANLDGFNTAAFDDLEVGADIGYKGFNHISTNDLHNKDLQLSYSENGVRHFVTLFSSMNIHSGSNGYQSNFLLVVKEKDCDEGSVFFALADKSTDGIVEHDFGEEKEYVPEKDNEDGYTYLPCKNCDEIKITGVVHRESNWLIDKEATTESNGVAHKECSGCGLLLESREFKIEEEDSFVDVSNTAGQIFISDVNSLGTLNIDTAPHTIEAVVQVPTTMKDRVGVIVGNYDGSGKNQVNLEVYTYGRIRLYMKNEQGGAVYFVFNTDIRSSQQTHVAVTVDGKRATLYINGEKAESAVIAHPVPDVSGEFRIGGDYRQYNLQYFKGIIHSVAMFSDVRTPDEVARDSVHVFSDAPDLIASKTFTATKKNLEKVKPVGQTFTPQTPYKLEDLVATPHTIEAVVNVPTTMSERAGVIFGNYNKTASKLLNLEIYNEGKVRLYVNNGKETATYLFETDIRSDRAVHLAVVIDTLSATLYVNGEAKETIDLNFSIPETTENFVIGGDNRSGNDQYFKGTIYSVNLFSDMRSEEEIKADRIAITSDEDLLFSRYFTVNNEAVFAVDSEGVSFSKDVTYDIGSLSETPHTIEAVIQIDKDFEDRAGTIFGNYDTLFHEQLNLEAFYNGQLRLFYSDTEGNRARVVFEPDVRSDEPVYVAVTIEGLIAKLYINGELADTKDMPFELVETLHKYKIGGDSRPGNEQFFKGTLQSVNVFGDVRTEEEIKADMVSVDKKAENLLVTRSFVTAATKNDIIPTALAGTTFNANSPVHIGKTFSTYPKTFEAIVQVDRDFNDRVGVIASNYDTLIHPQVSFEIYKQGKVRLFYMNEEGQKADCRFDTDIRSDKAVHIAVVADGLQANLYVNGELKETKELPFEIISTTNKFKIGGDNRIGNTEYFKGTLYSVNLFSNVRGQQEIIDDITSVNIADFNLLYSIMFAGDLCADNAHIESDWIYDFDSNEQTNGVAHTQCVNCGKVLSCRKIAMLSEIVDHRIFKDAQGLNAEADMSGVKVGDLSGAPLTFEATLQLDKDYAARAGVVMGNYDGSAKDQINLEIYTNGTPRLYYKTGGVAYSYNFKTDIRSDRVVHLAVVVDGLVARLYLNGDLKESVALSVPMPDVRDDFQIGSDSRASNPQHFKGTIYTAAIFGDIRTQQEIAVDRYLPASDSDNLLYSKSYLKN